MMGLRLRLDQRLRDWRVRGGRLLVGILVAAVSTVAVASCQMPTDNPALTTPAMGNPGPTWTVPAPTGLPTTPSASSTPEAATSPTADATSTAEPSPTRSPQPSATPPSPPAATATGRPKPSPAASQANSALFKDTADNFDAGERSGVEASPKGLTLIASQGQYTSPVQETPFAFNNAVLSWVADAPTGTSLKLEMRVRVDGTWSRWYTMGTWANGRGASAHGQSDGFGQVDIDTLKLRQPAQAFQYRATLSGSDATLVLRSVAVAYADMSRPLNGPAVPLEANWARDLPVPQISQAVQDPAIRWEICSPTSLTMVLNYWGANKPLMEVVSGVRDGTAGIYGNWPLNTAYAATQGFDAHVARFHSVEQLQNEIANGRPVVVSVRFAAGQLDNSPISSTTGHLIVVRGFTANGDVIVNDPAAPSHDTVRRVYHRDQFSRVWLSSGGIAYTLAPTD